MAMKQSRQVLLGARNLVVGGRTNGPGNKCS